MLEIDDSVEVEIRPEDIKMEVFRSGGAGGQKVNKTSSAGRLIHLPTGITVSCQNERSQFQNRDMCMKMLKSKPIKRGKRFSAREKTKPTKKIKRFFASEKIKPLKGFPGNGPLLHDGEQRRRESSRGIAIFWYGAMWP